MRRVLALYVLCCFSAHAEENPAITCNQQLVTEPRFAPITNKLPLGDMSEISFEKLAIKAIPTKKESKLIAEWVEAKNVCFNLGLEYAKTNYPPQLTALAMEAKNRVTAVVANLYNGEYSYGTANKQIQSISDDYRNKLTALVEQIKSEQIAQEQAKTVQDNQAAAQLENDRRYAAQQQAQAYAHQQQQEQADAQRRLMLLNSMRLPPPTPVVPYQVVPYQLPIRPSVVPYPIPVRPVTNTNCQQIGNAWSCQSQ